MGATPRESELVRLTLNSVSEDYQVFVQSILGRERLPRWEAMWATLQLEELRRDLLKIQLEDGSSGSKVKKEEEDKKTLSSKGQQRQKKKDLSKIKCFRCGEMGHYATQCSLKKKDKEEKEYLHAGVAKIEAEKDCAMLAHIPKGDKWDELEL